MDENRIDLNLKILTLGNQAVGKTCLLQRYCHNKYSSSYQSTIGIDYYKKQTEIEGKKLRLQLWDTTGQERFKGIVANYYRGSDGFLVTYSVEDRYSFDQISYWIKCIQSNCDQEQVQMVLIGNKSDSKKRVISIKEGADLAQSYNIPFFETSALLDNNCQEAVNALIFLCFKKARETGRLTRQNNNQSIVLSSQERDKDPVKKKRKCCSGD